MHTTVCDYHSKVPCCLLVPAATPMPAAPLTRRISQSQSVGYILQWFKRNPYAALIHHAASSAALVVTGSFRPV